MAKRDATHTVISASFLDSGAPAYLGSDGRWSMELQKAKVIESEGERDSLLEQALRQEGTVCDPYFFDVRVEAGAIDPLSARERIRALGPTTRIRRPD